MAKDTFLLMVNHVLGVKCLRFSKLITLTTILAHLGIQMPLVDLKDYAGFWPEYVNGWFPGIVLGEFVFWFQVGNDANFIRDMGEWMYVGRNYPHWPAVFS